MKKNHSIYVLLIVSFCWIAPVIRIMAGETEGKSKVTCIFSTKAMYPLASQWAAGFTRTNPDQPIRIEPFVKEDPESLDGIQGQIGFMTGSEVEQLTRKPAWQIVVGREVVVAVMNSNNPFREQLNSRGISAAALSSSITKPGMQLWGNLLEGNYSQPIHYYIINDKQVESKVSVFLGSEPGKPRFMKPVTREEFLSAIQNDPLALGFCSLPDITPTNSLTLAENTCLLPIDKNGNGKLDYLEQIYSDVETFTRGVWIGKYPKELTRELFVVSQAQPSDETNMMFLNWVLTDGQPVLNQNGYSDLVINERQSQLDKIKPVEIKATPTTDSASYFKYLLLGLAVLMTAGFLLDRMGRKVRKHQSTPGNDVPVQPVNFDENSLEVPNGLYFDKTHTWAFMEKDGTVRAGIDDFLRHITGPVTRIEMKMPGDRIKKGEPFLTLVHQGKKLVICSPVSGIIREHNQELTRNVAILHSSPLSEGWIYQIEPLNWMREIQFLAMAENYRLWIRIEFSRLKDFLAITLKPDNLRFDYVALQDGGTLKDQFLADLGPEVWEDFQNKFLNSVI
jgi:glycine cleavage system H lipoate-binding protein/ABC-type phosphate transport system substrate-binding protein